MKNLIKITLLTLLFISVSCSQEDENINTNNDFQTQNELNNRGNAILEINWDDIPSLTNEQAESLGYENIVNNIGSQAFLDKNTNILNVPYDSRLSQKTDTGYGLCIKIKIAKKNPSRNCRGGCMECIGFRCEFITFPCIISQSQNREQSAKVLINESTKTIEYHFQNEIDWNFM